MDFKQEVIAFEDFLKTHQLSVHAQLLWYKLMILSYNATYQEWIEISNATLMAQLQTRNKEVFKNNMEELVNHGLITLKKCKDNDLFKYKLNPITKELTN